MGKRKIAASRLHYRPHQCVVLGVDPGSEGGASIWKGATLLGSAAVSSVEGREQAVGLAFEQATEYGLPFVVVAETWAPQGKMGFKAALGLGAQWGRWLEHLDGCEQRIGRWVGPKVVRVLPGRWRGAVLGAMQNKGKHMLKQDAMSMARVLTAGRMPTTNDEAEAICIGYWGTLAAEVHEVLPSQFKRAA